MNNARPYTTGDARRALESSREDIATLIARDHESLQEKYRLLDLNSQMWRGVLKEEPPEYQPRMLREVAS